MTRCAEKKQELVEKIRSAFSSNKYPGDDNLVYDNSGDDLECVEIAAAFRNRSWEDISIETLRYHHESLFFLTADAYSFYLPAFLIASVLHYKAADLVPFYTICSLTAPKSNQPAMENFLRRVNSFSPQQKKVIKEFLQFMSLEHGSDFVVNHPTAALKRFWENA